MSSYQEVQYLLLNYLRISKFLHILKGKDGSCLLLYNKPSQNVWLKTIGIYLADDSVDQLGGSYSLDQFSWSLLGLQVHLQLAEDWRVAR